MKRTFSFMCGLMLVLGLLMAGVPAFADGAADGEPYVLTIVECPEDLDETLPSWNSVQLIDDTPYEVRTYYLGRGKWCFAMDAPEQRRLSAEEARQLLERAATPDDPFLLAVVDCPDDLDEAVPSRTVMQRIDNTFYRWREYYLGDGKWCIVMERPEHRSLSAHEATLLWEKSAGIGHEPTTPDPDDWVLLDPADCPWLNNAQPVELVLADDFGPPTEKSYSGEPDTGAPPHRLSPPEVVCYPQAKIDAPQERQETLDYIRGEATEGYQPSVVIGEDERVRVSLPEIQTYPWNTIGFIAATFPDNTTVEGTGFLVEAHTILTVAHVVYNEDRGGYAESVLFVPAQFQSEEGEFPLIAPYGLRHAVEVRVNQQYIDVWDPIYNWDMMEHDYAAVFIYEPFTDIADYITARYNHSPPYIHLAGYPEAVQGETESYSQWYSHDEVVEVHPRALRYLADMSPGQSGSPVWRESFWPWLRGFSAINAIESVFWNAGPRLVSANRDLIKDWMEWVPSGVDGLVYDAYTGWPLSGAAVEVHGTGKVAYTDSGGYYRIVLPPGIYTLMASCPTFDEETHTVEVVEGEYTTRHFALDPMYPGSPTPE